MNKFNKELYPIQFKNLNKTKPCLNFDWKYYLRHNNNYYYYLVTKLDEST